MKVKKKESPSPTLSGFPLITLVSADAELEKEKSRETKY